MYQIKRIATRTKNKCEAIKPLQEFEELYEKGRFDPCNPRPHVVAVDLTTLGGAVTAFIKSRSNLSPYTVTSKEHVGENAVMKSIKPERVKSFLNSTEKQAITKKTYSTTLSPFLFDVC